MREGFFLLSPDFTILDTNAEALRLETRPREEIVGRSHWVVYPHSAASEAGQMARDAMRDRVPRNIISEQIWPDGRRAWFEVRAYPVEDGCLAVFFRDVTERYRAERAARENADRFEGAVRAFADVLWTNDPTGRMVDEQPGWAALTGQGFEAYKGLGWAAAVHPDDAQPTMEAWQHAVATQQPFVFEHRVRRHDGVWRRFAIRAVPVLNDDTTIREWVGVHSDITELRENEVRFRQLADNIDAVFYVYEIDERRISYVSRAYEGIWQQPASALYADPRAFLEHIHADDRPILHEARARHHAGKNTDVRYRLDVPGTGIRHIHDRAFVTTGRDGEAIRVAGIAEDVTASTLTRLQLAANAATFEALVRNTPFGVYVVGSEFQLLHVSEGAAKVFAGIEPLIGRDFKEIIRIFWPPRYANEVIGHFQHTLATGETYVDPGTMEQRSNTSRSEAYDWRIDRIDLPDGTHGVVCYFYDLSDRMALEAELKQALADKDMLLREIDHRVRNSIAMTSALLSMQASGATSADVKEALTVASARLGAIARIHERLYKGKQLGVVEFGTYLEEICHDLRDSLGHDQVTLKMRTVEVGLPVDEAVPMGLIVNELVTNAFKHCGGGGACIEIELTASDKALTLRVFDDGVGMAADYDPAKRQGLGMRMIKTLVRQLKGTMVQPGAGEAARFEIRVPLPEMPAP